MAKLGDLVVAIGANTRDLDKALGKSMRKIKNFGKNTKQMGKSLSTSLTAPLAALGGLAIKTAADFEFSMAKVAAVSGFTANEMQALEQQAKQLGGSTSKSASDVASLQLELAKLGNSASEIQAMTESVLSLSIAFDTDLGQTASVVGATLNQFGLDASESGRVADNMATLFGSSALDLEKFDNAMRVVGPTANALGISLEDTGSALGILTNAGLDAGTAGTALTKAFTTLVQNGTPANEVLTKLTDGNLSVAEGFEIFGDRAGKIIPLLQGTTGELAALTQKQLENTGAAIEARKVLEDTAQGGFDALRSAVESAGITIGTALMPAVKKATAFITGIASALGGMNSSASAMVVTIAALVAAIGPLLMVLPLLVQGFMMVISPVGLIIAALGLLVAGIMTFSEEVSKPIATVVNYFISMYNEITFVRAIIGAIKGVVQTVFDFFGFAVQSVINRFQDLGDIMDALLEGNFSDIPGIIKSSFERAAEDALTFAEKAGQNIKEGIENELERDPIELVTPESVQGAIDSLGGLKDKIDALMSGGGGGGAAAIEARPKDMTAMAMRGATDTGERGLMGITDPKLIKARAEEAAAIHQQAIDGAEQRDSSYQNSVMQLAGSLQSTFSQLFTGLINGTQSFGDFMKQILMDLLVKLAAMVAAFIVISALTGGMTTAGGGAMKLGGFLKQGFGIPQFAAGGIVSGPTLAMVGEYSGASTNPEVIAPLDKLQSMMGGAGGNVTVTGRISGRDILLSNERANFERNRTRGF
jgi:PIN domain nuclease of toxin-antitoxin system